MKQNFIIQTINRKIVHDFVFTLERSIEYIKWLELDSEIDVIYSELYDIDTTVEQLGDKAKSYIPVGTVEFVFTFIDKVFGEGKSNLIKPLNVPSELFRFAGRNIANVTLTDNRAEELKNEFNFLFQDTTKQGFIKSTENIKDKVNGFYKLDEVLNAKIIPNGNYQISSHCDIASEYRCFVYYDDLVGLQNYSGDFTVFPSFDFIKEIINAYPYDMGYGIGKKAWSFDVGVLDDNKTNILIECHDYFSCGTYGFEDYGSHIKMICSAWRDIYKLINKNETT